MNVTIAIGAGTAVGTGAGTAAAITIVKLIRQQNDPHAGRFALGGHAAPTIDGKPGLGSDKIAIFPTPDFHARFPNAQSPR